jgi:hypothetical protein
VRYFLLHGGLQSCAVNDTYIVRTYVDLLV